MSANEKPPTQSAPNRLTPVEVADDPTISIPRSDWPTTDSEAVVASEYAEIKGIVQRPTSATKTSRPSTGGKRHSRVAPMDCNFCNCNQVITNH